ncbi:MAG TPA: TniB family NTP-binding protein [Candidatus Obscuribacter sp.]|nr:TniB family NTP-binding protein [Candidatus Obscuribacterales bacterium]HMX45181.1 TniB family NTP-binding protein [Candidatus Obscuribacter sp.]HMY53860.1 TniB family NTP-binding protein [Candidatus Obscuribacter sp.]HNA72581.1 TniB family NTP-binding protein [Candidatus Obscuribacter sp.]HNB17839.1 TniB family NTP-binding protein [Candidatus Obscuribacter sp.]
MGGKTIKYLTPAAQAATLLPDEERIQHLRADRWIGYTKARSALQRLEELFNWPSKLRMPNLLIIGPTNNGKSMIIEKFKRDHLWTAVREQADHEVIPVVVVQTPSEPAVARFYAMLLASIGAPIRPKARIAELEQLTLRLLKSVQAKILVIDELHNLLAGTTDVRQEFLNLLRFLGNELRIPIVGVGTRDAYLAIRSDAQLENRFEPLLLPVWEEGDELLALLASFSAVLPLKRVSDIANEATARYILARTEGTIGEIAKLLTAAAIVAIETGEESVNQRTLGQAAYLSPTERRQTFERALL